MIQPPYEPPRKDGSSPPVDEPPSATAFATGTGAVFQSVGVIFVLGVFLFWVLTTYFIPPSAEGGAHWSDDLRGDRLSAALLTFGVAATIVGGLGLIGAGIGLQGERPSSGNMAMLVTGVLMIVYWSNCALFFFGTESWIGTLLSGGFAVAGTLLFALALRSAAILRQFPPPPGHNVVTDEFLDQIRSQRHLDD